MKLLAKQPCMVYQFLVEWHLSYFQFGEIITICKRSPTGFSVNPSCSVKLHHGLEVGFGVVWGMSLTLR
jgi:hypothetical protein